MAKKSEIKENDPGFEAAMTASKDITSAYGTLREGQEKCEEAFFMDWTEKPSGSVKMTISPDPHNKVRGATRLLTSTSPAFNVPAEKNNPDAKQQSTICEAAANAIWAGSNAVQGIRVEKDIAHTGLLYGEMHLRTISTKDMLEAAKISQTESKDPDLKVLHEAYIAHCTNINARTPYLFEPLNPMTCYVRKSRAGLEAHYQKLQMTVANVIAAYGGRAESVLKDRKPYSDIEVNIWYDRGFCYVWVTGEKDPIMAKEHGLGFIPVSYYSPEGSYIYDKPERAVLPFLYPSIQSGIWQRQNLFLTVSATNAAALMNSQFVLEKGSDEAVVRIDHKELGGIIEVPPGSKLYPLSKEIINPAIVQLYGMFNDLMDESTIFDQTLGQPIAGNPTFSANALMNQIGRLPISPIKEGMSALFADAMGIAFQWLKKEKGKTSIGAKAGDVIEIEPKNIPESLVFSVDIDVDMPADKLQGARTGVDLAAAGLADKEWIRDNILGIGQSDTTQSKIWREQMADMAAQTVFPQFIQMLMTRLGIPAPIDPNAPPGGEIAPPVQSAGGNIEQAGSQTAPVAPIQSGMTPNQ